MNRHRCFVNLVVNKKHGGRPAFKLHRIDPARLFSRTRSPEPADPVPIKKAPALGRLPPAAVSFDWPCTLKSVGWMDFMALKNDIVAVDHEGRTLLYDGALGAVCAMNKMVDPRRHNSISLTVGGGLYSMIVDPALPHKVGYFNAFTYGPSFGRCLPEDWYWRPLRPPPLDYDHHEYDHISRTPSPHPCEIAGYTVVRDSQIWISTVGVGTYSFDTTSRAWSKVGEWALPFKGHAKYAPEHGLWFGFSESDGQLCVTDLALKSSPVKQNSWEELTVPEGWTAKTSHLLPLGCGKFCVVRFFEIIKRWRPRPPFYRSMTIDDIAVLTGVEFQRTAAGSLQMIKHKSKRYRFARDEKVKLV